MANFTLARFCAVYSTPEGETETLTKHNDFLEAPPAREWNVNTVQHNPVGARWGHDVPTGNARLSLSWRVYVRADSVAAVERKLRWLELQLNLNRAGKLRIEEAYSGEEPTMVTEWRAVVETARPVLLGSDEAPAGAGAWGAMEYTFTLTEPQILT